MERPHSQPDISLAKSLIPVVFLIGAIFIQIRIFEGDPHVPLILASCVGALTAIWAGCSWASVEQSILNGIVIALKAILILMVVGVLIGTWIAGGIVPFLIFYGLEILSPSFFLVAACLICCVVSLATGSSWTTAGTVGVALIGVAQGLDISLPMAAGAIVSGAYFGDKMSPLSDSTNLAPAVAGSELFEHIRYMVYTTGPALGLSLILYAVIGFFLGGEASAEANIQTIQSALQSEFTLSPLLLLPPLLIIGTVIFKIPALPALIGGCLLGGLFAMGMQGASLKEIVVVAQSGYAAETGNEAVDELLTRGGLDSMMWTVSLILCALAFGGVMEGAGMLKAIAAAILKLARSTGSLIAATVCSCVGMNVVAPDQYLSIIVPGRMYREAFEEKGLHPKLLSRCLEDAGTLSSPLVPWNTCGAFMMGALAVSPFDYLPYAFVNLLTPAIAILYGYTGWKIAYRR